MLNFQFKSHIISNHSLLRAILTLLLCSTCLGKYYKSYDADSFAYFKTVSMQGHLIPQFAERDDQHWRMFFIETENFTGKRKINAYIRYRKNGDQEDYFYMRRIHESPRTEIIPGDLLLYVGPEAPLTALLLSFYLDEGDDFDLNKEVHGVQEIIRYINEDLQEKHFKLIQLIVMTTFSSDAPKMENVSNVYFSNPRILSYMKRSLFLESTPKIEDKIVNSILLKFENEVIKIFAIHLDLWPKPHIKDTAKAIQFNHEKKMFLESLINITSNYFLSNIDTVIKPFLRNLVNKMLAEYNNLVDLFHYQSRQNFFFNSCIFRSYEHLYDSYMVSRADFLDKAYTRFINFAVPTTSPEDIDGEILASYAEFKKNIQQEYTSFKDVHEAYVEQSQIDILDIELDRAPKDVLVVRNALSEHFETHIRDYMEEYMTEMMVHVKEMRGRDYFAGDQINLTPFMHASGLLNPSIPGFSSRTQVPVTFIVEVLGPKSLL